MEKLDFIKKFFILESRLKSRFSGLEEKRFPELILYLKENNLASAGILFDLSRIWEIRNVAFGKPPELPEPKIPHEMPLIFRKLSWYFKIKL